MGRLRAHRGSWRYISTCAALALVPCTEAYAQSGEASATAGGAGEIVVTAQRREESLRDVPISVSAVSSEMLDQAGVDNSRELGMTVPGLRVEASGAFVQPTIRGITTVLTGPATASNIATYVDGVYQTTMTGAIYALPDVRSVEVLKGPQGTLFGRNATGGAILINTRAPNLTDVEGMLSASYGRFDNVTLKAYFNGPVIEDRLAAGFTGFYEHRGPYKRNLLTGKLSGDEDTILVRGKLRFVPWEGADFTLTGLYSRRDDFASIKNTNYRGNNAARAVLPASQIASGPYEYSTNEDPYAKVNMWSVSLRGNIEVGPGTLTTTTAYIKSDGELLSDLDNSPRALVKVVNPFFNESFQQEFVYATDKIGRFSGLAGFFFYKNSGGFDPVNINNFLQSIYTRERTTAYAGFAEVNFDVTNRISLTGGIRYSNETQRARAQLVLGSPVEPDPIAPLGVPKTFDAWTPRVSVLFRATDRTNFYATYSQGFKSGLFNASGRQAIPVNPEEVKSYEVGVKSDELRNVSLTLAGFYYDYTNLQQTAIVQINGTPTQIVTNAAQSEIYGAEFNGTLRVTPEFTLIGGATYLHARYINYPGAVVLIPGPTGFGNIQAGGPNGIDISGNTMIRSPEWSGNLTASYVAETSIGQVKAAATVFASTKFFLEVGNRIVQPKYALVNATLGIAPKALGGVEISLWGKNLTNRAVLYGQNLSANGDIVNYNLPRTYGVEVSYKF